MPFISGVQAGTLPELLEHWWQWVLVGVCFACVLLGLGHILFVLLQISWTYLGNKMQSPDALHAKVADHLRKYGRSLPQWSPEETKRKKPTSLGIFMGSFDRSISRHEVRSLSKHDIMILDPYQANLGRSLAALRRHIHHPIDIIGRLDLKAFPSSRVEMHKSDRFLIQLLDQIIDVALKPFKGSDGRNRFNGILLVGWEIFPSMVEK